MTQSQSPKPRIVYLIRAIAHFPYHQSSLDALVARGCEVQLVFDPKWSKGRATHFVDEWTRKNSQPPLQYFVLAAGQSKKWLALSRELLSYGSYVARPEQSEFYLKRWEGYLPEWWQRNLKRRSVGRTLKFLLGSWFGQSVLRTLERLTPADQAVKLCLEKLRADVVVASPVNMRFSEEVDYVKAAKALGIPVVLPVLSWDNLTTKGLIHVQPDRLLAWNRAHAEEAVAIHRIPKNRITITGSPFFDKWFSRDKLGSESNTAFLERVGLQTNQPFVTYLGSSGNIAKDESWIVENLAAEIAASSDPYLRSLQILVRPHPSNAKHYERLVGPSVKMWPRPPFKYELGVPEDESDLVDFQLSLQGCEAVIGINTSAMIEAAIVDKPVIAVFTPQYERTQEQANHFQQLLRADVLYRATDGASCLTVLSDLRRGSDPKRESRQAFVTEYVRPGGRNTTAGEHQAAAIVQEHVRSKHLAEAKSGVAGHPTPSRTIEAT